MRPANLAVGELEILLGPQEQTARKRSETGVPPWSPGSWMPGDLGALPTPYPVPTATW